MPTDRDQEIAYHLAGTVRLPSPAPAVGSVAIVVRHWTDGGEPDLYLKVVQALGPQVRVTRTIHLADVKAIASDEFAESGTTIRTAREVAAIVRAKVGPKAVPDVAGAGAGVAAGAGAAIAGAAAVAQSEFRAEEVPWLDRAVVYVPESASVLTTSDAGMTAAESATYHPPIARMLIAQADNFCEDCPIVA